MTMTPPLSFFDAIQQTVGLFIQYPLASAVQVYLSIGISYLFLNTNHWGGPPAHRIVTWPVGVWRTLQLWISMWAHERVRDEVRDD